VRLAGSSSFSLLLPLQRKMGRKKNKKGVEIKPFCYYCDRKFDDEQVLFSTSVRSTSNASNATRK